MIILNTRPSAYNDLFVSAFRAVGLPIVNCPVIEPQILPTRFPDPKEIDALIFTSPFAAHLCPADAEWASLPVLAVGPATAKAARAAGFRRVSRTGHCAIDLIDYFANCGLNQALHVSGQDVTVDLPSIFWSRVRRLTAYRMTPVDRLSDAAHTSLGQGIPTYAPLFSHRSAQVFANLALPFAQCITAVGISAHALDVEQPGWNAKILAAVPTLEAMVDALHGHLSLLRRAA